MTAKLTTNYRVFTNLDSHALDDGTSYVNIRVASRKDRNKTIDVAVYLPSGERFKLKRGQLENFIVVKGFNEEKRIQFNRYLEKLETRIKDFVDENLAFTKATIEKHLYTEAFLQKHKKKRTREKQVEIKETIPTDLYKELRKLYPKKRDIEKVSIIDEDGFEVIEEKPIVIDPLSLEEFPKNFSPILYEQFKNDALATLSEEKRENYLTGNKWFLDQFILFHINANKLLFKSKTKEVVTIDKEILQQFEKEHPTGESYVVNKTSTGQTYGINTTQTLLKMKQLRDFKNLSTEDIYKKDLWDHNNIFEMFGSVYYDGTTNETYQKIVLRLMEYREHCKPSENIKDFNVDWLIEFFAFLKRKEAWYHISTKSFDPLKYDPKIFFQDKKRFPYQTKSLNAMISMVKTLCISTDKSEKTISFYSKGWIPLLDLSKLKKDPEVKGTRIDHSLTKFELDQLYWFKFDEQKLNSYQLIFNRLNKSKGITVSINDFETARKLFLLQVMFGGLRGYKELSTAKVNKHDNDHIVTFYQNKVTNTVTNPFNDYTEKILKPLKYQIPLLHRINTHDKTKKVTNINLMEQHYRILLQSIGEIIGYEREILIDSKKYIHKKVKDIFNPYFARKTFGQILYDDLKLRETEIILFTGHVDKSETELGTSYVNKKSVQKKKELIAGLKVGKNPFK